MTKTNHRETLMKTLEKAYNEGLHPDLILMDWETKEELDNELVTRDNVKDIVVSNIRTEFGYNVAFLTCSNVPKGLMLAVQSKPSVAK